MKTSNESLISPSIDSLLEKVENKYVLALLSAKRARELFDGDDVTIDEYYINKVTTAINEIDQGKVTYVHGVDEIQAEETADDVSEE
ncbi:MAG: DNA-directed RNA polymerase subunit omega [Anaerofustis stercorihominis]|nr:DNA-directed RNA polymerase subunit omega [Anaerofustis stercorihominis]